MLTAVARSCVRHGRKIPVAAAELSLFSAARCSPRGPSLTRVRAASQHRSSALLTPAPRQPPRRLEVRSAPLTAATQGGEDPLGAASAPEDSEKFGSLSTDISARRVFRKSKPEIQELRLRERDPWEEDEQEEEPVDARGRSAAGNTQYWYFLQCKKLIKDNRLQEALDLFSRDMLHGERLQPMEFNYTVLIGGCGRAGQLKRAFKLYNDMKKRGLTAVDATYTALFNACAESRFQQAGLQQALKLEQELRRKNYPLSTITYHALLKAHAVTNHLQACIHTLREMLQNGHVVTQETFHYLLMGCLKDKKMGFRLALQVWRQMLRSGILPDSTNYNLLLRTARDCGIGDSALASEILLSSEWDSEKGTKLVMSQSSCKEVIDIDLLEKQLFLQPGPHRGGEEAVSRKESTELVSVRQTENFLLPVDLVTTAAPNLLDIFEGRRTAVVSLGSMDRAYDRLALIGGAKGFLEKMADKGLRPDLRTLTLLVDMTEPGYLSLQMLLRVAKQHQVKLDVAFFNSAIRRAARAGDQEAAKGVLSVMRQRNVSVDVQTFGCLALGCEQKEDGLQLLKDMEEAGFRPNVHVFSALIGRAVRRLDYIYLKTLLKCMSDMEVWPNEVIIKQLEFAAQYPPNYNQHKSRNNYLIQIDGFRGYYQQWLRAMPAQDAENEQAPVKTEADAAVPKTEAADGLTQAQRNQRAAARRFGSQNKSKTSSSCQKQPS